MPLDPKQTNAAGAPNPIAIPEGQNQTAPALNPQGLTAQQMGQLAEKQMQERVMAQAQAVPGTLQTGATTGTIQTGTGTTPLKFQAITTPAGQGPQPIQQVQYIPPPEKPPQPQIPQGEQAVFNEQTRQWERVSTGFDPIKGPQTTQQYEIESFKPSGTYYDPATKLYTDERLFAQNRLVNVPTVMNTDTKNMIDRGLYGDDSGILSTDDYAKSRGSLNSVITNAEKTPLNEALALSDSFAQTIIKSNMDEYNRLTAFAAGTAPDPMLEILRGRALRIASNMASAVTDIHAQAEVSLREQDKLNKQLEGKARAAINAAGQVGSMVGEGYLASQLQNNLDALNAIRASEQKAVTDARIAFENQQDDIAFKMVGIIEERRQQANDILQKNFQIVKDVESIRMQRHEFAMKIRNAAIDQEVGKLELEGKREDAAMRKITNLVKSGFEFNVETAPEFMEAAKVLGWKPRALEGFIKTTEAAARSQKLSAELKTAKELNDYLKDFAPGQRIEIGGRAYFGTQGTGTMEVDENGNGRMLVVDQTSGAVKVREFGKIGKGSRDQFDIITDGAGNPFIFNKTQGRWVGSAGDSPQTNDTWDELMPQGSIWTRNGRPATECGEYINDITGLNFGNSLEDKISKADLGFNVNATSTGDVVITSEGAKYGHVAMIKEKTLLPDGNIQFTLSESNYKKNDKGQGVITHNRKILASDPMIKGFAKSPNLHPMLATGGDALTIPRGTPPGWVPKTAKNDKLLELVPTDEIMKLNKELGMAIPVGTTRGQLAALGLTPGSILPSAAFMDADLFSQRFNLSGEASNAAYAQYQQDANNIITAANIIVPSMKSIEAGRGVKKNIEEALRTGNMQLAKEALKNAATNSVSSDEQKMVRGRDAAISQLSNIKKVITEYRNAGGDMGLLRGTEEQIAGSLGRVTDPELRKFATMMRTSLIDYRKSVSGAAFTESEMKEYKDLFPSISNNYTLNISKIDGLLGVFESGQESFYRSTLTDSLYQDIFGSEPSIVSESLPPLNAEERLEQANIEASRQSWWEVLARPITLYGGRFQAIMPQAGDVATRVTPPAPIRPSEAPPIGKIWVLDTITNQIGSLFPYEISNRFKPL